MIGFLRTAAAATSTHLIGAFWQGLGETGFVEGQNVAVEYRFSDDQHDRLPAMAADLVRRRVAVIVTNGLAVPAVKAAAPAIPIVFLTGYDPVRTGFVASLSRPGGNLTGVVFTVTDLVPKQLGLLHELVPRAAVIAVLLDPNQLESDIETREAEAAGRALGRQILFAKASVSTNSMRPSRRSCRRVRRAARRRGPVFLNRRRQLVAHVARHALPAAYTSREYAEVGGLMSYGPSLTDAYRRAGTYAGRILKARSPAICRSSWRASSSWSSTWRRRREWASTFHRCCWPAPTR